MIKVIMAKIKITVTINESKENTDKPKKKCGTPVYPMKTQEMAGVPVQIPSHYIGVTQHRLQKLERNAIKKGHIAIN